MPISLYIRQHTTCVLSSAVTHFWWLLYALTGLLLTLRLVFHVLSRKNNCIRAIDVLFALIIMTRIICLTDRSKGPTIGLYRAAVTAIDIDTIQLYIYGYSLYRTLLVSYM